MLGCGSHIEQFVRNGNSRKFRLLSARIDSFVITMRFHLELIGFDDAVFIRQTRISGILPFDPGTKRILVRRFVGIFEILEAVMYKHPGAGSRLVSVLVD